MNAKTTPELCDKDTASAALRKVRDDLTESAESLARHTDELWNHVIRIRPKGLLTVDEMAEAIDRDRNYVDSIWSAHGETTKGKQTRVPVAEGVDADAARCAYETLTKAAAELKQAASRVSDARAERNRVVALVYGSKLLGPSAIAATVEVDRNHVLRIARKAGHKPVHRVGSRNQYTTGN